MPHPHRIGVVVAPRDRAARPFMRRAPILHVILLGQPGRALIADDIVAQHVLHLVRRLLRRQEDAPDLGLIRPVRVPGTHALYPVREGDVREDRPAMAEETRLLAAQRLPFVAAIAEIILDDGHLLIRRQIFVILRKELAACRMPLRPDADIEQFHLALAGNGVVGVAPLHPGRRQHDSVDRGVAGVVVVIAGEILRAPLPIAGHAPFEDAAKRLPIAIGAVGQLAVIVEIEAQIADRGFEIGRRLVPAGEDVAAIAVDAGLDQPPLRFVEFVVVGAVHLRHADQRALIVEHPGVEGTGEFRRIALVIAADPHAAVPTIVEEDMQLAMPVPVEDYRFLRHASEDVIARLRHLAFMTDEQPGARENALELVLVDLLAGENIPADHALIEIDQPALVADRPCAAHRLRLNSIAGGKHSGFPAAAATRVANCRRI